MNFITIIDLKRGVNYYLIIIIKNGYVKLL